ncbi:MAG: ferritin family protein [Deltaproteobacteria bacterium]|nr:ferritin family protein [Deltaproteobacteria bacterium]
MSVAFSGKEVLEIAIQIEKNGFTFYSHAAQKVTDNKVRELIEWLAQEEKSHIGRFENILSSFNPQELDMSPAEFEEYSLYLKALADARVFTSELKAREATMLIKTEIDAIDIAIGFEKDSLLFLHWIKMMVKGSDAVIVEKLQREEMLHLKKLVELKR